jgi:glycosyltransferase involved in cell wall biosynthesis
MEEGIPEEKLVVMHNGIHPQQFDGPSADPLGLKRRLGDALVIGFVGFVRRWHRLDYVLHLMAGRLAGMNLKLLVVGDGPERPYLERTIDELGLEDRVVWTGTLNHDQVPQALAAMDIALQPAATEYASPLKLFEYMAARKAIVAPALPNIEEIITNEKQGLLFEPGNLEAMGEALVRLARDRRLRLRLGRAARHHLLKGAFTWDSNAEQVTHMMGTME